MLTNTNFNNSENKITSKSLVGTAMKCIAERVTNNINLLCMHFIAILYMTAERTNEAVNKMKMERLQREEIPVK